MFYATHDADGGHISENAHIAAFETLDQAREYLLSPYDRAACWDMASAEIGAGRFGDCWIKVHDEPDLEAHYVAPFAPDQLYVRRPGQHPGGHRWWIEPVPDVLVVEAIEETA